MGLEVMAMARKRSKQCAPQCPTSLHFAPQRQVSSPLNRGNLFTYSQPGRSVRNRNSGRQELRMPAAISVVVEHGIALQPGVAIGQRYFDPAKDPGLKLEGSVVVVLPAPRL